jgi:ATP-dependent DNA helicase RecQ
VDTDSLKKDLKKINDLGIISYTPQKDKPQITLLQNRMYTENYMINTVDYLKRKQNFEQRVAAMIGYINKNTGCRSQHIANYFTDLKVNACGICDNCINEKVIYISTEEFNSITHQVLGLTKKAPVSVLEILGALKGIKKEKIWKVVDYLQAEKKIQADKEGNITII